MKRLGILLGLMVSIARGGEVREQAVEHAGAKFRVVTVEADRVGLVWKGPDDKPYETFDRVQAGFRQKGKTVKFLMNAGIYEPGKIPSGIHVEDRKEGNPLNPRDGRGNFFLKPNGVFWIGVIGSRQRVTAQVAATEAYPARTRFADVRLAVQSGPMLLFDGKRHPKFVEGSANRLHRNGVGVDGDGKVVFAITAPGQVVNLWDFAGLFLKLGCREALFLDGDISQMAVNPKEPVQGNRFAAMFVVAE